MRFRRREPAPGVFRLVLPLPFPGFDRVNAYLLSDANGSVLVDCGIYDPNNAPANNFEELSAAVTATGVSTGSIDRLVVTHAHIDHYGLAGRVQEEWGCTLWMHGAAHDELEAYRNPARAIAELKALLADHGVDSAEIEELSGFEDWRGFVHSFVEPDTTLAGGEVLKVGGRSWEIVYTPGHSPSHICLFDPDERLLVSGDHLLPTVTPHIDFRRNGGGDPLGEFLESLEKVEALEPDLVLPGHGRPFRDGAARARVIARHHDRRLGAILQVVRSEPRSADDITDEIFGTTLLNFQRRLALGEALAHLAYLRKREEVERLVGDDGTFLYRKATRRRRFEE